MRELGAGRTPVASGAWPGAAPGWLGCADWLGSESIRREGSLRFLGPGGLEAPGVLAGGGASGSLLLGGGTAASTWRGGGSSHACIDIRGATR